MSVFARSDLQSIGAVPGCDQQHARPHDARTGLPVPIWELTCAVHVAWITGADRPKVTQWEPNGSGGYRQVKMSHPRSTEWSATIEGIPLTPDQQQAELRRNGLTRRSEQAMLQQGLASMARAYDFAPATRELLQARKFAGKATATCASCYKTCLSTAMYCPDCGVRLPAAAIQAAVQPAEA